MNTAIFLKKVRPFFNIMHERDKGNFGAISVEF